MQKEMMITGNQAQTECPFMFVTGDVNAYIVTFIAPREVNGVLEIAGTRSDGTVVTDSVNFAGNTAQYTFKNSFYSVAGELKLQLRTVEENGTQITQTEIVCLVEQGAQDEGIEADDRYPILNQLIVRAQEAANAVQAATDAAKAASEGAQAAQEQTQKSKNLYNQMSELKQETQNTLTDCETVLTAFEKKEKFIVPMANVSDTGKILTVQAEGESRLEYSVVDITCRVAIQAYGVLSDGETAYMDVYKWLLEEVGIQNPMDESCVYGFNLEPLVIDTVAEYDIVVDNVTELDDVYRMTFPLHQCPLLGEYEDAILIDLFNLMYFKAEYPIGTAAPQWTSVQQAFPAAFIDEKIITPACSVANAYTDQKAEAVMERLQQGLTTAKGNVFTSWETVRFEYPNAVSGATELKLTFSNMVPGYGYFVTFDGVSLEGVLANDVNVLIINSENQTVQWYNGNTLVEEEMYINEGFFQKMRSTPYVDLATEQGFDCSVEVTYSDLVTPNNVLNYVDIKTEKLRPFVPVVDVKRAATITVAANTVTNIAQGTNVFTVELGAGEEGRDNQWVFTVLQGQYDRAVNLPIIHWIGGTAPVFAKYTTTMCRLFYIRDTLCGEWMQL